VAAFQTGPHILNRPVFLFHQCGSQIADIVGLGGLAFAAKIFRHFGQQHHLLLSGEFVEPISGGHNISGGDVRL